MRLHVGVSCVLRESFWNALPSRSSRRVHPLFLTEKLSTHRNSEWEKWTDGVLAGGVSPSEREKRRFEYAYTHCMRENFSGSESFSRWKTLQTGVRTRFFYGLVHGKRVFSYWLSVPYASWKEKLVDFAVNRTKILQTNTKFLSHEVTFASLFLWLHWIFCQIEHESGVNGTKFRSVLTKSMRFFLYFIKILPLFITFFVSYLNFSRELGA